ncbi:hypothetical protein Barb7_00384 [Bacteroidales bacterium Barb7]|nr:hypothetical protein Barb7_00384 [Bacteroidales bacterium Barb7]
MPEKDIDAISFYRMYYFFIRAGRDVFPLSGAKWTEVRRTEHFDDYVEFYYCYETIGDTVIDGIKRSKIYETSVDGVGYLYLVGFIDIREKQVIFRYGLE